MKRPVRAVPLAIGILIGAALFAVILTVQHVRHGWPFSLHHGLSPVSRETHPATRGAPGEVGEPAAHARAPVEMDPDRAVAVGVRLTPARVERMGEPLRLVAVVTPDEARVSHVHTRIAGWIERLYVNTTGQRVRRGEPLAEIFSPELLSSQNEYLVALRGGSEALRDGARQRLRVLGLTDAQIRAIERRGTAERTVTLHAPRDGVVLRRNIAVGTAVDPSTEIVTVADLSQVWVLAEVPEANIPSIPIGVPATLSFPASGRPPFESSVEFLYPTISERTRTLRVRFVVDNPGGALRPGMYGDATFRVAPREVLTVPRDAVVDTGEQQHVFVAEEPGHFMPRTVTVGVRAGERIEIREGLEAGEQVVASGVFLIDSESRLRASGGAGAGHAHGGHVPAEPTERPAPAQAPTPRPTPSPSRTRPPPQTPTPGPSPARTGEHSGHGGHP